MTKYIDADKAIEYFEKHRRLAIHKDDIVAYLANLPTSDVQEVKHGEWIKCSDEEFQSSWLCGVRCSICGKPAPTVYGNYCSICGAKMDGGEKTDED